jgi:hypothetical protein
MVQLRRSRRSLRFVATEVLRGSDVPGWGRSAILLRVQEALHGERGLPDELLRSHSELEPERVSSSVVLRRAVRARRSFSSRL